ncbi:MAG: hypothetical protein D8M53_01640 [Armatimonadetes bacterium]|nr:hypothetical protein [Armatimonadota bacterium]
MYQYALTRTDTWGDAIRIEGLLPGHGAARGVVARPIPFDSTEAMCAEQVSELTDLAMGPGGAITKES